MNYIGSKLSLLDFIGSSIHKVIDENCTTFCDLFAGTGAVGEFFKKEGFSVISNDIQFYSYVLNKNYIENHEELSFENLESEIPEMKNLPNFQKPNLVCNFLNSIPLKEGFIFLNFCYGGTKDTVFPRQYFSDENGKRCDAIRQKIEEWFQDKNINDKEYFFLLCSLLESIDKVANTASVYGAFLKKLKKSAQKTFLLKPANFFTNKKKHKVYNEDTNSLIKKISGDILYLDPPYNHRQYATNYHLLETIAKYDNPKLNGKTGLRSYQNQKSLYCLKQKVETAFKELISNADFRYIFLSYNNEGLLPLEKIKEILSLKGDYGFFTKDYNRFKADKDSNRSFKANKTTEYLHFVKVKF